MTDYRLAVMGGGNMGAALVGGLISNGWAAGDVIVVEVAAARRDALAEMFPDVAVAATVPTCEAAVIAVKPYDAETAATAAGAAGGGRGVAIAAGVSRQSLQRARREGVARAG